MPRAVVPDTVVPDTVVPDTVVPDTVVPDTVVPDTVVPGFVVSGAWCLEPGAVMLDGELTVGVMQRRLGRQRVSTRPGIASGLPAVSQRWAHLRRAFGISRNAS